MERGEYIGFHYTVSKLHFYLLAIANRDEDELKHLMKEYTYRTNFSDPAGIIRSYNDQVDFRTIKVVSCTHNPPELEIVLSFTSKSDEEVKMIAYKANYSNHEIEDFYNERHEQ